jgi:uncharacterized protein YdaU (DUF1376 family)
MAKPPAFQTYAADFFMDTNSWTVEEIGIYWRLLMTEWTNRTLPDDEERLSRIAGCKLKIFKKFWPIISQKFVHDGEGNLINLRMEEVREAQDLYIESQREKGKSGAEKRWKDKMAGAMAKPMPDDSSSSSTSSSTLNKNKRISKSHCEMPNPCVKQFIDFYFISFKKRFSREPFIQGGKHGKMVKNMLKVLPLEEMKDLLIRFLVSDDPFIRRSGYTLEAFQSQIQKLKIGNTSRDGVDLWLKVKEEQNGIQGQKAICGPDEKAPGDIPYQPVRER